jgi:hypothetical protein
MTEPDRASCRRAAAECVRLAGLTGDMETKQILLTRAQEWLKLAYADHDGEFERLVGDFNAQQMGEHVPPPEPMQRQPMQQQQTKAKKKAE